MGLPGVRELFEHAPCGLLLTDADGTIRRANATFCHWLGLAAPDLVDRRRLQDLLTMGGRIFHQTHWAPLLQIQRSIAEVKLDLVRVDGRKLPVLMNAARRVHGEREFDEVSITVAEDRHAYERELLAARRRAEELLAQEQRSQRALAEAESRLREALGLTQDRALFAEQLIGIVSHDLRTPLQAIRLNAQLLLRQATPVADTPGRLLNGIARSTRRAQRLVEDLLDFTATRHGRSLSVVTAQLVLDRVVRESVDELRMAYPGRGIEHRHEGGESGFGDPDRIAQMMGNLVANAMAYGDPASPVGVASRVDADGACSISVSNTGRCIDPDFLPQLFEPMVRGAAGGQQSSVGLGLYIVREIARAHAGEVAVRSSDGATVFTVSWPGAEAASRPPN